MFTKESASQSTCREIGENGILLSFSVIAGKEILVEDLHLLERKGPP
jgi:hypothetical protein